MAGSPESGQHDRMTGARRRHGLGLRLTLALGLALGAAFGGAAGPSVGGTAAVEFALPAWSGGVDLYRPGVFTTQRSWLWCTAAGVQIVSNIVEHERDHTTSGQRRYFEWMRRHNRYDLPLSAGVDPAGWTAGLRRFVDGRYRLVASRTFDGALRSAVTRMRLTKLPVALTVSHGNHGWILTGFRATADPARTDDFAVTSVRVVGPLYGLQSRDGYDMPPNTQLTTAQLRRFFTPWKYKPMPMVWDGRYVSIQPVPSGTESGSPVAVTPQPPAPRQSGGATPSAAASSPAISPSATPAGEPSAAPVAVVDQGPSPAPGDGDLSDPSSDAGDAVPSSEIVAFAGGVVLLTVLAAAGVLVVNVRSRRAP